MQEDQEDAMNGSLLGDIDTAAGDMLCYARWLDGWIGCYAWIGSDRNGLDQIQFQFRQGSEHPKV